MSVIVKFFILLNILIIQSQIVASEPGTIRKLICKFSTETVGSVLKIRDHFKAIAKCASCSLGETHRDLRNRYRTFIKNLFTSKVQNRTGNQTEAPTTISGVTEMVTETGTETGTGTETVTEIERETGTEIERETFTEIEREIATTTKSTSSTYRHKVRSLNNQTRQDTSFPLGLINHHGYNTEIHTVLTPDGYYLTLHRLLPLEFKQQNKNKTVILHHGLLGSSVDWILLGPKFSLAYMLVDSGYDVWLGNARGNRYSKAHVSKSIHSSEYWDFSWHEIGLYDLSSTIDYVKEKSSGKNEIIFVAHSMSATALMVLLSTSPQYNTVINIVILLAPLVFMQQAMGPLRLLSEYQTLDYEATVKLLGGNHFSLSESFMRFSSKKFCKNYNTLCHNPLFLLVDGGKTAMNGYTKDILKNLIPSGSVKSILHLCQLINSGRFEMFDAGSSINLKKYGTVSPPKYHLRNIKLPVVLFNSHNDWLSTAPSIVNLLSYLPKPIVHHIVHTKSVEFNHLDFVFSINARDLVYKYILEILEEL